MSGKTWIKRLKVDHYGPLGEVDLELDEGLNVFYGRNESGKTLLVESITKMLLDDSSGFQGIGRVPQEPAGMMIAESNGEEFEVSQEKLNSLFENVTAEDIRNAFVIRDFDLRLPERDNDFGNGNYFNDVTDRVLGSKSQKIQAIRDEISDINFLTNNTSEAKIENRKNTGHIRQKKENAEELKQEIDKFIDEIRSEGLIEKYSQLDKLKKEIQSQEELLDKLEEARKREKYLEGEQLLEDLQNIENDMEELESEQRALEEARELKQNAENFEPEKISGYGFYRKSSIATGTLSGLSIIASIINPTPIFAATSLIFLAAAAYTAYNYRKQDKKLEEHDIKKENLLEKAEAKGLEADSLPEIAEEVEKWKREINNRKSSLEKQRGEIAGTFKAEFNTGSEQVDDWKQILNEFSKKFEDVDQQYREGAIEESEKELEQVKQQKENLEDQLSNYSERIQNYNSKVSEVLIPRFIDSDPVDIEVFEDLENASRQLNRFTNGIGQMEKSSKQALGILEEMEQSEEDEFNKVFKEDSYAVKMFQEATDGNYTDISYSKSDGTLKVERKDGQILSPAQLSQGTYDLLYMSVRLKLAKEILGEPGFLVLDNAFVHSDIERVDKEIEFLQNLEEEGWQIIYFTFRDDVKDRLEEVTDVKELEKLEF